LTPLAYSPFFLLTFLAILLTRMLGVITFASDKHFGRFT
jgi:hypothetical protein